MPHLGKLLIIFGVLIVVSGLAIWGFSRLGFRGLPGDISYRSGNVRVYVPIVTCIVVSLLLTLALWALQWFTRR